ncbi:MAG: SUMF1/EgtB/PvdO family nonheme iron enzyme [Bacteroidetes bacterium]|nr:SUMF1/EgtB/PvdO family nonheme iron enzyme [Bacteroidota bacterium]
MEKDFSVGPDSMDLLLKQAFLKLDENNLSNQKLNNMLANSILNSSEVIYVNSSKEKELFEKINSINKGGFFTTGKLWLLFFVIVSICVLTYYLNNKDQVNINAIVTSYNIKPGRPLSEANTAVVLEDSLAEKAETLSMQENINPIKELGLETVPLAMNEQGPLQAIPDFTFNTVIEPEVKKAEVDDENMPVLTEDDKKKNRKRKEAMIKSMLKAKPGEWVKINASGAGMAAEYYLMTTEISNINYKVFLMDLVEQNKATEYHKAKVNNNLWRSIGIGGFASKYFLSTKFHDHAVVNISADGMRMYCEWLTELVNNSKQNKIAAKYKVRLPSEKEWKLACTSTVVPEPIYTNGLNVMINSKHCMLANYKPLPQNGEIVSNPNYRCDDSTQFVIGNNKYCTTIKDSLIAYPVMVFAFNPSYRGLYCMAGNVSEVVTKDNGEYRSIGGNWNSTRTYLKMDAKDEFENKPLQNPFVGFRVLFVKEK